MIFNALSNEVRQRLIDVQQRGEALRAVRIEISRRFTGSMAWKPRSGAEYLYRRNGPIEKSLGVRSTETEAAYNAFVTGKQAAEERRSGLRQALEDMIPVNRAMGLNRVPTIVARILRRLDDAGVLGDQVCVVGTNALFAYEAIAGIRFDSGLLATVDLDIALDARRGLGLAARSMPKGFLQLLREADPSFVPVRAGAFRAVNNAGMMVDLITPEPRDPTRAAAPSRRRLGAINAESPQDDLDAVEIPKLEMIVDAPRVATIAIAEDGLPVWLTAADPRWWAAHKLWLSTELSREPIKRQRDQDQALAVASMLAKHWVTNDLSDAALAAIPASLRQDLRDAVKAARIGSNISPDW